MPFRIRDQHGAARAVAYLMLAAAVYNLVASVLMKLGEPLVELVASGVAALGFLTIGVICLRRPRALPRLFWPAVPLLSTLTITGLNYATRDTTLGPQLFYLWPLLYSASFLGRWLTVATVALISAGHGAVAFSYMADTGHALADWFAITVAMAMTAFVVAGLRERNSRLLEVLEAQASSDSLTGVANRRAFDRELARTVRAAAGGGDPVALITVDVDHFKSINDGWGHATGDRALRAVADALSDVPSPGERLVARLGGDEFAVLLRAGPDEALRYAERARARVGAVTDLPCGPPKLSIGIAVLPDHARTAEELQRVADAALYQAKERGRGQSAVAVTAA
ncbi:GGDEF domain-containing protein [Actinoplanes sp. NPDC023714]|uniref:GGDEF domain-containing protein n=1 Tax=Actinoplanes sp. NPDC023714 TaxID=3154322 RepID=UPI0033F9E151